MNRDDLRARVVMRWVPFTAAAMLGAAISLMLARSPTSVIVHFERSPVTIQVPVPVSPSPEKPPRATVPRRIGCTLPWSQIGLAGDESLTTRSPTDLQGVAASATGCTIAIWGSHDVFVSRDDGASFTRLVAGDAQADPRAVNVFPAVAVGADEAVYVARAEQLQIELADGTTRERVLPGSGFYRIEVSGRWLIVQSRDRLATSEDAGVTWHPQPTPAAMTTSAVFVDDGGAIHLAAATGMDAPITYYLGDVHGRGWQAIWTSPPHRSYGSPNDPSRIDSYHSSIDAFAFGNDGRLYAQRYDSYGYQVFAVSASGAAASADKLEDPSVLRGASIAGTSRYWGARDAHGLTLSIFRGRGPVRTSENLDRLIDVSWGSGNGRGRWLVGSIVP